MAIRDVEHMTAAQLLGRAEDLHLELKPAVALKQPENLLREVVGMLNAEGGQIMVGIEEKAGHAIAIEHIEHAETQQMALQDQILDRIQPRPQDTAVKIVEIADKQILAVDVPPGVNKPYAFARQGALVFVRRYHDRLRPMSLEEVKNLLREAPMPQEKQLQAGMERLRTAREQFLCAYAGTPIFRMVLTPMSTEAEVLDLKAAKPLLTDPTATHNRPLGWTFHSGTPVQPVQGGVETGRRSPLYRHLTVLRDGHIEFCTLLDDFRWQEPEWVKKEGAKVLYPYCLTEFPASVMRLASALYRRLQVPVLAESLFANAAGWYISPYRPESLGWLRRFDWRTPLDQEEIICGPLLFTAAEVQDTPDRCAFRLLRLLYEAAGYDYDEESMPFYNKNAQRFVFE